MTQDKVDMYIANYAKFFPSDKVFLLKDKLVACDDSKYVMLASIDLKDPTTILIVSIFLGGLGIDRFMIGDVGMGILKLLTGGLCGVLTLIDWFVISGKTKEKNFQSVIQIL